tara:strand:+ start:128 stop:334 length:207 start_codon:yes stop_codon:yes gene_type:complete
MRTYFCECGGKVEVIKNVVGECKCGKLFGVGNSKVSDGINMRKTWSSQTQVEFSQTTIDEDIKQRNSK